MCETHIVESKHALSRIRCRDAWQIRNHVRRQKRKYVIMVIPVFNVTCITSII